MHQPDEQTTQQENDAAVPAKDIQGNVLTGSVDDGSVDELPDTIEAGDDAAVDELPDTVEASIDSAVDRTVVVTRTTTITNSSDGSVIQESSVSRPSDMDSSEAAEDEFIQGLLASGWKSRGKANQPSSTQPMKALTKTQQFGKAGKEVPKRSDKSNPNEKPPPPTKKTAPGKKS